MGEGKPLTVLIADDSEAYRAGMSRAIKASAELDLVAEVDGGQEAFDQIVELEPDVALLDVRMPGLDGLEVCERLEALEDGPLTRVILLSAYVDDGVVQRARDVGARAYLSKSAARRDILGEAVRVGREVN